VRELALIVVLFGASCAREPEPSTEVADAVNHQLPTWAPLPPPNLTVAQPRPWVADGRPTLLLFSASWCKGCSAGLLTDVAIARAYGERFQVGVALVEDSDVEFSRSPMARLLAEVPVWSSSSVRAFATLCGAAAIPMACLVDRGRVVFRGSAASARLVLDAHGDGRFGARLAANAAAQAAVVARLVLGVSDTDIAEIVNATHGDHGWQNRIAWQLASRRNASATDVALAVALARDVVAADGGLDYSHLDTYTLALSKAGLPDDAAAVGWRVLAVCKTVHADCMVERRRAYAFIYYARERGLQSAR
jgi:hypothetical protein